MTEPTYTIKPLVWKYDGEDDDYEAWGFNCWLHVYKSDSPRLWSFSVQDSASAYLRGAEGCGFESHTAAKLAAESAYRKLLEEHLDAV